MDLGEVTRSGRTSRARSKPITSSLIGVGVGAPTREGAPMLKGVHHESDPNATRGSASCSRLDEIVRDGTRQMLAAALQAEASAYIAAFRDELDENGYRLVVRNGYNAEREVTTAPSTGSACAPPTRSSPPSPPSDCGSGSPRDPALVPPVSRWRSSSSSPPNAAGAPSTNPPGRARPRRGTGRQGRPCRTTRRPRIKM